MFLRRTFTTAALVGALGAGLVAASLPAGAVARPAAPAKHAVTRAVPFTVFGTVQATDTTADTLTVAKSASVSVTVSVPDTAIVYRNWTRADLADLVVGDWIGVAGLKQTDARLGRLPRPGPRASAGPLQRGGQAHRHRHRRSKADPCPTEGSSAHRPRLGFCDHPSQRQGRHPR